MLRHRARRDATPTSWSTIVAALEPTFGGINLEDIKAPECFYIERKLRERMKIPVFHDDQHGTAIIVGAAMLNGLEVVGKDIGEVKLVVLRRAAPPRSPASTCWSSSACRARTSWSTDITGVVYEGRTRADGPEQGALCAATRARARSPTSSPGADMFLGLSAGGVLKPEMVKTDGARSR